MVKPKNKKDCNLGLKQPSENRLRAQDMISAHRQQSSNQEQNDVDGENIDNNVTGINIVDQNEVNPNIDENTTDNVKGTNQSDPGDVQGTNIKPSTSTDVSMQGVNDADTKGENDLNEAPPDSNAAKKGAILSHNNVASLSYHKRKPKPTGKHHHPVPLPDPPSSDDEPPDHTSTSKKPEFVTQKFGIIKRKEDVNLAVPCASIRLIAK